MASSMEESWSSFKNRTSERRVVPLISRVINTKPVAMIPIKWAMGVATCSFSVTASASASVMAPRSPPQTMVTLNGVGTGGERRDHASSGNMPNTTAPRATSPATLAIRISTQSQRVMPTSRCGTSMDASTNTKDPAQNTNCCHSWLRNSHVCGRTVDGP